MIAVPQARTTVELALHENADAPLRIAAPLRMPIREKTKNKRNKHNIAEPRSITRSIYVIVNVVRIHFIYVSKYEVIICLLSLYLSLLKFNKRNR